MRNPIAWCALFAFTAGCATVDSTPDPPPTAVTPSFDAQEAARVAALPRIPDLIEITPLPETLRGLSFRLRTRIAGSLVGDETLAQAEQLCFTSFSQFLTGVGWAPIGASAAHPDLTIESACTGHATWAVRGDLIEIKFPVSSDTPAVILQHHGEVVATVLAGPLADFLCPINGAPPELAFASCATRAQQWAQSLIVNAIVGSQPLATLAQQLKAARTAPPDPVLNPYPHRRVLDPYPAAAASPPSPPPAASASTASARIDDEAVAMLDLGVALYEKGDLKGAREQFAATQKLVPDKPNPWRWLGLVDARLGRCATAIGELEQFLQRARSDDPRAVEVKELRDGCKRLQRR